MQEKNPPPRPGKGLLIKLGVLAVVGLVGVVLLLRGFDVKGWIHIAMDWVRALGPLAFFGAMAILPAIGFPLLAFALTAGPAFREQMGLGPVLLASAAAILINIIISYWLARYALRPVLERWLGKLGYRIPVVDPADYVEVAILVRITQGPPFFVQNYLLGLAQIPFRIYVLPSLLVPTLNVSGVVIFGDAIAQGKGKWAVFGISLLVAVGIGVHMLRRHMARKKQAVAGLK